MKKKIYVIKDNKNWRIQCEHCNQAMAYTQREGLKIARKHIGDLPQGTISSIITKGKNK